MEGPALPHRPIPLLQLPPEPLLNAGERCEALRQIHIHVLIASQEAFGKILRYADGVGEVQRGRPHRPQDVFLHQPAGMLVNDVSAPFGLAQLLNVPFEVLGLAFAC